MSLWASQMDSEAFMVESLNTEGFIHLCTKSQLQGVLNRYYKNVSDLILLHIEEDLLTERLVYESSTNDELFPHLYGSINKNAITKCLVI
jgi:uncharacterized protein (DUF952 family)